MLWLKFFALFACILGALQISAGESSTETLSPSDARFCFGELEVIYPELDISDCTIIPQRQRLREKISKQWGPPQMRLASADKKKKYTLMMVDPDAPSRSNPTRSHWRHWLVSDIKGSGLRTGNFKGTILSEYSRPTPPQHSGLHRYQFILFEQPADQTLSLSKEEKTSLGNWDQQAFIMRFCLGSPVAAVQFLTQNHKD